eukprot:10702789-Alexandrium_andersonii.AAC.1
MGGGTSSPPQGCTPAREVRRRRSGMPHAASSKVRGRPPGRPRTQQVSRTGTSRPPSSSSEDRRPRGDASA